MTKTNRDEGHVYCTTYCNQAHSVRTGVPIGHKCYVLPPKALKCEMAGDIDAAIAILQDSKPLERHRGI